MAKKQLRSGALVSELCHPAPCRPSVAPSRASLSWPHPPPRNPSAVSAVTRRGRLLSKRRRQLQPNRPLRRCDVPSAPPPTRPPPGRRAFCLHGASHLHAEVRSRRSVPVVDEEEGLLGTGRGQRRGRGLRWCAVSRGSTRQPLRRRAPPPPSSPAAGPGSRRARRLRRHLGHAGGADSDNSEDQSSRSSSKLFFAKLARLRQAKEEAERERAEYRAQMEVDFQRKVAESSGGSGANVKRLEQETNTKIEQLKQPPLRISPLR